MNQVVFLHVSNDWSGVYELIQDLQERGIDYSSEYDPRMDTETIRY